MFYMFSRNILHLEIFYIIARNILHMLQTFLIKHNVARVVNTLRADLFLLEVAQNVATLDGFVSLGKSNVTKKEF